MPASSAVTTNDKRPRLSTSCNWCRSHKLKCDTEQPSCSNCRRRGKECVTTNLRKGGSISQRVAPLGRHRKRPRVDNSTPPRDTPTGTVSASNTPTQEAGLEPWHSDGLRTIRQSEPNQSTLGPNTPGPGIVPDSTSEKAIFSLPFSLHDQDHEEGSERGTRTLPTNDSLSSQDVANISSVNDDEHMSGGIDLTMLTDDSPGRLQMMGISSSLYILIQWLDLFFAQRPDWKTIFPHFRQGMAYTVRYSFSVTILASEPFSTSPFVITLLI